MNPQKTFSILAACLTLIIFESNIDTAQAAFTNLEFYSNSSDIALKVRFDDLGKTILQQKSTDKSNIATYKGLLIENNTLHNSKYLHSTSLPTPNQESNDIVWWSYIFSHLVIILICAFLATNYHHKNLILLQKLLSNSSISSKRLLNIAGYNKLNKK